MKIAQIGNGFVGSALHKSFKGKGCNTIIYDKFQDIGSIKEVLSSEILFMCLPTPYVDGFGFDLSALTENLKLLSSNNYKGLIVIKSTIEPGSTERLSFQYENLLICHNPEFLTAKTAFEDFDGQKHIVLGSTKKAADQGSKLVFKLYGLYKKLYPDAQISLCKSEESEAMKLFCNNFYAMKVQIFNEFYYLSQKLGIDFDNIKEMMFKNNWINPMHTMVPGTDGAPSYGGACVDPESILFEKEKGKIKAKEVAIGNHIFDGKKFTRVTRVGQRLVKNSIEINSRGRILKASEDHIHMVYNQDSNLLEEKLFRDIKTSDYVYIPRPKYGIKNYILMGDKPKIKGIKNWKNKVEITPKLARLFGLYCAEGFSGIYKYKALDRVAKKKEYTVCWTFGPDEEFLADEVINTLSPFGLQAKKRFTISPNATFGESRTWRVRKRSYWLYQLFSKIGLGHSAFDKNSPLFVKESAKAFISGWLDGDGFFDKSNNSISGFSRSKELISLVDKMLLSLGIHGSITKDGQQINVSMRDDVINVLSWSSHPRFCIEPKYKTNYKWASTNSSKYKDGWITKIRSIKVEEKLTEVISIETESHLYVANGMLTHNCFPKDTNALCHMMKTLGSPHDVLEACIGERNKMRELKLK
jgi:UDP-glucose 6-dehydrogenase